MQDTQRDVQRKRVYQADKALDPFKTGKDLSEVDGIRRYLIEVCGRKRVQDMLPRVSFSKLIHDLKCHQVKIHNGAGTTIARGGASRLNFPLWSRKDGIVLHEFAHLLHAREEQTYRSTYMHDLDETYRQVHGWRFVQILEGLVLHVLGREAHTAYRKACKEAKVRNRPKKKLSPETLEKLRERGRKLAAARSALTPSNPCSTSADLCAPSS